MDEKRHKAPLDHEDTENNTASMKNRTVEKVSNFFRRFWRYLVGLAAIVAVITRLETLSTWMQQLPIDIFYLSKVYQIVLGGITLISWAILAIYARQAKSAPKPVVIFALIGGLCGILLTQQREPKDETIIIVYDNETPTYHSPLNGDIETQRLSELRKLEMVGQLDKKTALLSTVERPVLRWEQAFPTGLSMERPVLSLQEVLETQNPNFIDISFSSFQDEILQVLDNKNDSMSEIRLFYEYDYVIAEHRLKEHLRSGNKKFIVNSVLFDHQSNKLLLEPDVTVVFLGSPAGLESFMRKTSVTDYQHLIVPSWLRPNIQKAEEGVLIESKRVCAVSSVLNNLVKRDHETWQSIIGTVQEEMKSSNRNDFEKNIKDRVLGRFAKINHTKIVSF